MNIGFAYQLKSELAKAKLYALQAETIFRHFFNSLGLADVWGNLGLLYLEQDEWQKAQSYLNASLDMWRSLKNKFGEIKTMLYLVEYDLARGRKQRATVQLNKLEHLIEEHSEEMQHRPLRLLLTKYRRSLTGDLTKPPEVVETSGVK